jgi:hypothetical protein
MFRTKDNDSSKKTRSVMVSGDKDFLRAPSTWPTTENNRSTGQEVAEMVKKRRASRESVGKWCPETSDSSTFLFMCTYREITWTSLRDWPPRQVARRVESTTTLCTTETLGAIILTSFEHLRKPLLFVVLLYVVDHNRRWFALDQFHYDMLTTLLIFRFHAHHTQGMILQPQGINDGIGLSH